MHWLTIGLLGFKEIGSVIALLLLNVIFENAASNSNEILVALFFITTTILKYRNTKLSYDEEKFVYTTGLIKITKTLISIDSIDTIDISRPFLPRLFGASVVKIENNSDGTSIPLRFFSHKLALEVFKDFSVTNVEDSIPLIAKAKNGERFRHAVRSIIEENLIVTIAGVYVAAFVLWFFPYQIITNFEFDPTNVLHVVVSTWIVIIVPGVSPTLIKQALLRYFKAMLNAYNFAMEWSSEITVRQGLFNLKEKTIELDKTQVFISSQGWLNRMFGLWKTEVATAQGEVHVLEPSGFPYAEFFLEKTVDIKYSDRYDFPPIAKRREMVRFIWKISLFLTLITPIYLISPMWWVFGAVYSVAVLAVVLFVVNKRFYDSFWTYDSRVVIEGLHSFSSKIALLDMKKIQNVYVTQSFFQKRKNVSTIVLSCIGKGSFIKIQDIENDRVQDLLRKVDNAINL